MFKQKKFNYAVFGNPIDHSKSPEIHSFFAKQTGLFHLYHSVCVKKEHFSFTIYEFFKNSGKGANITAPFKKEAYLLSHKLTKRAEIARSVNTLKKINYDEFIGDNTDGVGLLSDLMRLNFIKPGYSVLILGAGGAVQGILHSILSFGCSVSILNRTLDNAKKLVLKFNQYGKIKILDKDCDKLKKFDLIINAKSKNVIEEHDILPFFSFSSETFFYDINYSSCDTPFISWCKKNGVRTVSDGIGMLIFQAAHSFFLWHNVLPDTNEIIRFFHQKKHLDSD